MQSIQDRPSAAPTGHAASALTETAILFVLFITVGVLVRVPYLSTGFGFDDYMARPLLGLVGTGRMDLSAFVLDPWNEHFIPLWKVTYYLESVFFSLRTEVWHLVAIVWQAVSATCLYFLLRHAACGRAGAVAAALLWAGIVLAGWDEPHLYIWNHNYVIALAWILLAQLCVTQSRGPNSRAYALAMVCCATVAVLFWSVVLGLLLAIPVQYFLVTSPQQSADRHVWFWSICWLIVLVSLCIIVAWYVLPRMDSLNRSILFQPGQAAIRAAALFGAALWCLATSSPPTVDHGQLLLSFLFGTVLVVLLFFFGERRFRLVMVFFVAAVIYLLMTNLKRGDWALADVIRSTRYLYIPVLFWCVVAGALFDAAVVRLRPSIRRWAIASGSVLLCLHLYCQSQAALKAAGNTSAV